MSPAPKRGPGWTCDCGTYNGSDRTSCIGCGKRPRTKIPIPTSSPFDALRLVDEDGEYWTGRDLQPLMQYSRWEDFATVIEKAKASLSLVQGSGQADHHFGISRSDGGRWGNQQLENYRLTRFGAYLTAMAGDDTKEAVAHARVYFATKTREAEIQAPRTLGDPLDELELSNQRLGQAIEIAKSERAGRIAAEERASEMEGPAHSWELLASGKGDYSVADAAKILSRDPVISIGRDRLFTELSDAEWIYRQRSDRRWRVYQTQIDNGRMSELPQHYENRDTGETALAAPQVRIRVKGLRELHRQLGGIAALRLGDQLAIGGAS